MRRKRILVAILLFGVLTLQSQTDSLYKNLDVLGMEDLFLNDSLTIRTRVAAASRSLQNVSELPFSVYVINRADIIKNGFITLVDALKSVPGIRVSQPGSAIEGETFIMRGLLGNTYAKILINGVPIKPYAVSGMPIGAQLPIQQAERIEIIQGPSAALYGADASSGIINIVMAESNRPVFTKASLHTGSDSYKSLNLLFGGKVGKGENIIRFKLFGTDTRFDDRRIFYDRDSLYNPSRYINPISSGTDIFSDDNYRGSLTETNIQNTPHESRLLGASITYRFLEFSVSSMNRSDHSSIGLNPSAVSYANPLINTGETINSAVLSSNFSINNLNFKTQLEYLGYSMHETTSNLYVHPTLNALLFNGITDTLNRASIQEEIENNFFSQFRFSGGNSEEVSIEQTLNAPVFAKGNLSLGVKYLRGTSNSLLEFQPRVVNFDRQTTQNIDQAFENQNIEEISFFVQLFLPIQDKINLFLGGQYLDRTSGDFGEPINSFNPRLAMLYKYSDKLQFRASYSTAIRAPSPYFSATSYQYTQGNYESLSTGIGKLDTERTEAYEVGARWELFKKLDLDFNFSYTITNGFINYNIRFDRPPSMNGRVSDFTLGYFNDENSKAELYDFQTYLRFKNLIPAIKLGGTFSLNLGKGIESLTTTSFIELGNRSRKLDGLRGHPSALSRLSLFAYPTSSFYLQIDQVFASQSLTRNSFRLNTRPNQPSEGPGQYISGYHTMDVIMNYNIDKNFLFYIKLFNIFNTKYGGIDASSSNDVLFYNPQSQFIFHLGLNYEFN